MSLSTRRIGGGLLLIVLVMALTACAGADKKEPEGPVYRQAQSLPPLEVPPDLTAPEADEAYAVPSIDGRVSARQVEGASGPRYASQSGVLPRFDSIEVERVGDMRWLVVQAAPEQLWPKLREFWRQQGLNLELDEPSIGLMQTDWAENRAGVLQGSWRRYLGKVYDAGVRDQYRLRVERLADGRSAVYLTHRGAREAAADDDVVKWEIAPSDPEKEAIMQNRLMVYLGMDEEKAGQRLAEAPDQAPGIKLTRMDGLDVLVVSERYPVVWQRTGIALDRMGLLVDDQDRSAGIYYVTYKGSTEQHGFLSGLFGGGDQLEEDVSYRVALTDRGDRVEIRAQDADGKPLESKSAADLLGRLETELK